MLSTNVHSKLTDTHFHEHSFRLVSRISLKNRPHFHTFAKNRFDCSHSDFGITMTVGKYVGTSKKQVIPT